MDKRSLTKRIVVHVLATMLYLASGNLLSAEPELLHEGVFDVTHWSPRQSAVVNLSGDWKFFPNQLVTPLQFEQQPGLQLLATTLQVPFSWNNLVGANDWAARGYGIGTYWLQFNGARPSVPVSISISRVCSSARLYFFAQGTAPDQPISQLGRVGHTAQQSTPYSGATIATLPFTDAPVHHLLVQVSNYDFFSGGICGGVRLGESEALQLQHSQRIGNHAMLITMVATAALYLVVLMSQRRNRNQRAAWLTTMCVGACVLFLSTSGLLESMVLGQHAWLYSLRVKLAYIGATWGSTGLLMYYSRYYPLYRNRRLNRFCLVFSISCSAFFLLASASTITSLHTMWVSYWAAVALYAAYILGRACLNRMRYSIHNLVAILPMSICLMFDSLRVSELNEIPIFSLYAMVFFIFANGSLMARRISEAVALAEKLSVNLKHQVNQRTAELNDRNDKLRRAQRELEEMNEALKKLSITDSLTGIYNRMHFEQEFRKEWRRSTRVKKPISVLMIDVDHFKQLNDSAGHLAGDMALRGIATALNRHFKRAGDIVARYGGEEFIVMLPNTDQATALAIAGGVRARVERLEFSFNDKPYKTTVSIGLSTCKPTGKTDPDALLAAADSALYQAKNAGRNRVEAIPLLPSLGYGTKRHQRNS